MAKIIFENGLISANYIRAKRDGGHCILSFVHIPWSDGERRPFTLYFNCIHVYGILFERVGAHHIHTD